MVFGGCPCFTLRQGTAGRHLMQAARAVAPQQRPPAFKACVVFCAGERRGTLGVVFKRILRLRGLDVVVAVFSRLDGRMLCIWRFAQKQEGCIAELAPVIGSVAWSCALRPGGSCGITQAAAVLDGAAAMSMPDGRQ